MNSARYAQSLLGVCTRYMPGLCLAYSPYLPLRLSPFISLYFVLIYLSIDLSILLHPSGHLPLLLPANLCYFRAIYPTLRSLSVHEK